MVDVEVDHEAMDALMEVEGQARGRSAQLHGTPRLDLAACLGAALSPWPVPLLHPLSPCLEEVPGSTGSVAMQQAAASSSAVAAAAAGAQPQPGGGAGTTPCRPSSAASSETAAICTLR